MFGNNMFREFEEDPFFRGHNQMMQHMMQGFNAPFATGLPSHNSRAVMGPGAAAFPGDPLHNSSLAMPGSTFGTMSPFLGMNSMMHQMHGNFESMGNDPNTHCFSSSSVMSYSSDGRNPPKIYKAQTSTRQAPGGVKEVNRTVHDSNAGLKKMSVGRQIGDRRHVMEKAQDLRTGDLEENEEYDNMDEMDAPVFNSEWQDIVGQRRSHRPQLHARPRPIEDREMADRRSRRHAHARGHRL